MLKRLFLILTITIFNLTLCYSYAQKNVDSLYRVLKNSKPDTNYVNTLTLLNREYFSINPEKALAYEKQNLLLAKSLGFKSGVANCYMFIATVYYQKDDFILANTYYNNALKISTELGNKNNTANCYIYIGNIYYHQSHYPQALSFYQKALNIYEEISDKRGIAGSWNNIGMIFLEMKDYNHALKCYRKGLTKFIEIKDKKNTASCYLNIATIMDIQGNIYESIKYLKKSLTIYTEIDDKSGIAGCYKNIGVIYKETNNYEKSLAFFQKSLSLFKKLGSKSDIAECDLNISDIFIKKEQFQQALTSAEEAFEISNKINARENIKGAYKCIADSYEGLGNTKQALIYYKLYAEIKDSILNNESQKKMIEMETRYESEKREKEIKEQNLKIDVLEQKEALGKYKRYGLTSGIAIIAIISIIIFINLKKRITLNRQLYESRKLLSDAELNQEKLKSLHLHKELEYKTMELEYKDKELTNLALHIVEKNEFLDKLKSLIIDNEENLKPKEILLSIDDNMMGLEKERKEFEDKIERVSQGFSLKLKEIIPDITKTEERLAALLRLNLSSKEIALVFKISAQSVDIYRHRLRKKLNLKKEDNLVDFLNKI